MSSTFTTEAWVPTLGRDIKAGDSVRWHRGTWQRRDYGYRIGFAISDAEVVEGRDMVLVAVRVIDGTTTSHTTVCTAADGTAFHVLKEQP